MKTTPLLLAIMLTLAGCASGGAGMVGADGAPVDLRNAEVSSKTMGNGDTVEEYRVAGQVRMVKVTPARGATFYLYDRDGDGHMDNDNDGPSPVYWKLYSW